MYLILNDEVAIPISPSILQPGRRGRFIQPAHHHQQHKHGFYPRTIRDWNLLPSKLKDSPSLDSFKNGLPVRYYSVLICAALVLPPRCDTSEGLASIPQKQKQRHRPNPTHGWPDPRANLSCKLTTTISSYLMLTNIVNLKSHCQGHTVV